MAEQSTLRRKATGRRLSVTLYRLRQRDRFKPPVDRETAGEVASCSSKPSPAPEFTPEATAILDGKKNIRLK